MYQMPFTQHYQQNHGTAPPQMKFDTNGSPSGVFSHGNPIPMGCYGCCNYGYIPAYCNQPYPYYPPPLPFYYHGAYPSFPPMYYSPPLHYPIDQPRYDFDKNHLTDHRCCGSSGNQCSWNGDRHVNIEQQEPKTDNISTNTTGPEIKQQDRDNENIYTNTLVPVEPSKHREQKPGDLRIENNVKTEESNKFPFPIFWVPYEASKEGEKYPKEVDLLGTKTDNSVIGAKESEGKVGIESRPEEIRKKHSFPKLIAVKQAGVDEEKTDKEIVKEKGHSKKKLSEIATKPKLPPVCLRVEPLGKRKIGNSRSSSPTRKENKSSSCAQNEENVVKSTERETKAIEVVDGKTRKNSREDKRVEGSMDIKENEERRAKETKESEITNKTFEEETNALEKKKKTETNMLEKTENEKCEWEAKARKKLSEVQAAVIIQNAYRGFEVRRWDPLKKLKQIGEIKEKVDEVRSRIEALGASSGSSDDKQRVVIGETIMSLLLKLDTIQGLHPTVREIRKSVVKDLASLQEQLDSLGNKSSKFSTLELEEDPIREQAKAETGIENVVVAPQDVVPKEVCEEAKDNIKPVSSNELNHEDGAKEEFTHSNSVDFEDGNILSVELVKEYENDLNKHRRMATTTNDLEPYALTNQLSVCDGELCLENKRHNGPISKEMCEDLQGRDYKFPSKDAIDTSEAIAITEELQGLVDECEDETKQMIDIESEEVEQEKVSEEDHSEEVSKSKDVEQYEMDQDSDLAEENQELLEKKYVVEIENTENNKNMDPVKTEDREKQLEIGSVEIENVEKNKNMEPVETENREKKFEFGSEIGLGSDRKPVEENEKLREMVAKLVEAGREQLSVISSLSGRVKDLEMKLGKKRKPRMRRIRVGPSCVKPSDCMTKGAVQGVAV